MPKTEKTWYRCPAPNCRKLGFQKKAVWYPDQPNSRMKCRECGEWAELHEWKENEASNGR